MQIVEFREFIESADTELQIEEPGGLLELPINGWVVHTREETVRLIGYISRGEGATARREPTIILHVPLRGFARSMAHGLVAWRRRFGAAQAH